MTHRKEQAESVLMRAISEVLMRDISDPRLAGMISVTDIDVSPDLKRAKVSVSVLPEQYESRTLHGLRDAAKHIHHHVCKKVAMRTVPHLDFVLDRGLKKQAEILEAIKQANEREDEAGPTASEIESDPRDENESEPRA